MSTARKRPFGGSSGTLTERTFVHCGGGFDEVFSQGDELIGYHCTACGAAFGLRRCETCQEVYPDFRGNPISAGKPIDPTDAHVVNCRSCFSNTVCPTTTQCDDCKIVENRQCPECPKTMPITARQKRNGTGKLACSVPCLRRRRRRVVAEREGRTYKPRLPRNQPQPTPE